MKALKVIGILCLIEAGLYAAGFGYLYMRGIIPEELLP